MSSATATPTEDAFLQERFREFYADVARLKRAVLADPWGIGARKDAGAEAGTLEGTAVGAVSQRLLELLERQAREAGRRGGEPGAAFYREAQYVMAALADEVFLNMEWAGKEAWESNLLEARLFDSHMAGELFFRRLDVLLKDRDAVYRDVAAVYLMALCLGFEGKYRGTRQREELEDYRRQLFAFVFRRQPSLLKGERRLFPQSYDHTVREKADVRLPHTGRWMAAVAVVSLFYLLVSHGLWRDVTLPLREVNTQITQLTAEP
jgi:type VI secretion system protein ImpK